MNVSDEDLKPLTIFESLMIYLFERSIIDHITVILSLILFGGWLYVRD